jgi:hypothetical protein
MFREDEKKKAMNMRRERMKKGKKNQEDKAK